MTTYRDRWIECTSDDVRIRAYYFPWGTKRIPYSQIKGMRRVTTSLARGQGRIWGTSNPRYWASLDPKRPAKTVAFVLDLDRMVHPFLTPDDPDAFDEAVRSHVELAPPEDDGEPGRAPIV